MNKVTSELEKYQGEYLSIESLKNGFLTNGNLMCLLVAIKNIEDIKEIKEKLEKSKLSINKTIEEINEKTNEIRIENSMNTNCRNIVDNLKKYINVYEIDNIPDKRFKIMEYMKEYERNLMYECAGMNLGLVKNYLQLTGNANVLDEDRTSLLHVVTNLLIIGMQNRIT